MAGTGGGSGRVLAKNFSVITGGKMLHIFLTLPYLPALTRGLGPRYFGLFCFAQSFASQFKAAGDFGLNTLTVRTVAVGREGNEFVAGTAIVRVFMFLLAFGAMAAVARAMGYTGIELYVVAAIGFSFLSIVLSGFPRAVFRGNNWMGLNVAVELGEYLLIVTGTLVLLKLRLGLSAIGGWMALCNLATVCAAFAYLRIRGYRLGPVYGARRLRQVFVLAAPLAASLLLENLYYNMDVVLLTGFKGLVCAGLYGSAPRLIRIVLNFPRLLAMASLPVFSMLHASDQHVMRDLFRRILRWNLVLSVAAAGGLVVFANTLVPLVFGREYIDAVYNLRVQAMAIPFFFGYYAVHTMLVASGKLRSLLYGWIVAAAVNLGLNLWLIPDFADRGASWTRLLSEIVAFSVWYALLAKGVMSGSIHPYLWRLLAAVFVPAASSFLAIERGVPWPTAVILYLVLLVALLVALKVAQPKEIRSLWRSVKSRGEAEAPPPD